MSNRFWFFLMCYFTVILFAPALIILCLTGSFYWEVVQAPLIITLPFWTFSIIRQVRIKKMEAFSKKLNEDGEISYAKLIRLSNESLEDKNLYDAVFLVYIPSLDEVKKISKPILDKSKYFKVGKYFECRYLEGKINITGYNPKVRNLPGSPLLLEEKFNEYIKNN